MTSAWWGREAGARGARIVMGRSGPQPELVAANAESVRRAVRDRIPGFTPDWTSLTRDDAGVALVRVFGFELEPVLRRVNRLPETSFVEFLDAGGVRPLPPLPAETLVRFTVAQAADPAPIVPAGTQLSAAGAGGALVTYETEAAVAATAAEIVEIHVQEGGLLTEIDPKGKQPFLPFGRRARAGHAFWLGLSPEPAVGATLSLGALVAAPPGAPPPASAGGVVPLPILPAPLLRWELLDGGTFEPLSVDLDETVGFARSGVIELRLPPRWRPGRPSLLHDGPLLRWLRVRIVHGSFPAPASLTSVFPNAARAVAARTIRDEALEPLDSGPDDPRTVMRVTQTPVLPGSLVLEVDEGVTADVFGVGTGAPSPTPSIRRWREVDDLAQFGLDDRVFVLDPASGEVRFGDGINGMRVPSGFRNVVARAYRVGGGAAGAVGAGAVKTMLTSVPFVTGVANPLPASGGTDAEPIESVLRRGPKELRARGRAVTAADYEVLANAAPGAQVARAHAVAGLHPAHPGARLPGVVAVYIVPPDRGEGPPIPDQDSLRNVARYLSSEVAPAGVEVVAAAPRYHAVRVETRVTIDRAADPSTVVRNVTAALDEYLHPLTGGAAHDGWQFGGPIRYVPLVQRVLAVVDVRSVDRLDFLVDGIRAAPCADRPLSPNSLVWPGAHEISAEPERAA